MLYLLGDRWLVRQLCGFPCEWTGHQGMELAKRSPVQSSVARNLAYPVVSETRLCAKEGVGDVEPQACRALKRSWLDAVQALAELL